MMKGQLPQATTVFHTFVRLLHLPSKQPKVKYDAVIVGAGHNGLVCGAYLQKAGCNVCILERRHVVGGAAVTEEIIPGFKFSRASYVLSLLRPQIYKDLQLENHGLKVYERNPNLYTPLRPDFWKSNSPRSLTLGQDDSYNKEQIAKFSHLDAEIYAEYEQHLMKIVKIVEPFLDTSPTDIGKIFSEDTYIKKVLHVLSTPELKIAGKQLLSSANDFPALWDFMTAPASKILSRWFESEPLKATLATDSLIGSMVGPHTPGSGYVLIHHMLGQVNGKIGAWGYPRGGMGAVSEALASAAKSCGAEIFTSQAVEKILLDSSGEAIGVITTEGREILGKIVLSNATPHITFLQLLPSGVLPSQYESAIRSTEYSSPVTKINVALSQLPEFISDPSTVGNKPMPFHRCTINLNCENLDVLTKAYEAATKGKISERPLIEMVIPSVLDDSLCPKGSHVCLLFTQYTPYHLANGQVWDNTTKERYAKLVFDNIEEYAPGFTKSVIGKEILSPPDIENEFGLTGGNIFHGALSPDQLLLGRPAPGGGGPSAPAAPFTPVPRLLLCGSGSHPGGGVMGAAGLIAARSAIRLLKKS
ncbi:pyridine nucleotide-disulfide oxidoreductase domain-containing protein 2-like [Schistocerca gregaria]|uniref:pyridine nucleotide-disulfide oxidoreductase domain-containing protein 2-like n=1 Tax=Schistocerca gregaria TaxID=7010 RepID=UPI00211ED773|nr:pyridine nucleotide-disulfide oxidoreductase domain-containing protein 2-like [Schistocerca gregaria]